MEPPPALIFQDAGGNAPTLITLGASADMELASASAVFNGATASGAFLACMSLYSQADVLIGRFFPSQRFAVGDSGEVTFAPFLGGADAVSTVTLQLKVFADATALTVGDGALIVVADEEIGGLNLIDVAAYVTTVSSAGTPTVQIRNVTQAADMLTTRITIDAIEFTSFTAATQPVIDTANDDLALGDLIAVDVDVAGTGARGLGVVLTFG